MLSEKIKSKVLNEKLKEMLFHGSKFRTNNFDSISNNSSVINSIKNSLYTYGYDESIGYFFIIVDPNNEGFLFTRKTYNDNGLKVTHDFVIATEEFNEIKEFCLLLNINLAKDKYTELLRSTDPLTIPYSIESVFSRLYFAPRNNSYKKPKKAKTLGLLIWNLFLSKDLDNEFKDNLSEYEISLINMYTNGEVNSPDINLIISIIIINHIKYICENNININSIYNFILNDI